MHREVGVRVSALRGLIALLFGLVAAMLLITAGAARASCYSSTASNQTFTDPLGDASPNPDPSAPDAPDIGNTSVSLNAGCGITINPSVSSLNNDQLVLTWINTDGNGATGDISIGGADKVVQAAAGFAPTLFGCSVTPCEGSGGTPLLAVGTAGFATDLNQLGVPGPTALGLVIEADHFSAGPTLDNVDYAPDGPPGYAFATSFSTAPPPPPPPPPPPSKPPAPSTTVQTTGCTVPKLKGKSVSRAKKALAKAGCKYKIKGKGKVVSTNPKAGTQTAETVRVKAKKKRKRHSSRALTRAAAGSWATR
jgi:PASTA domain